MSIEHTLSMPHTSAIARQSGSMAIIMYSEWMLQGIDVARSIADFIHFY